MGKHAHIRGAYSSSLRRRPVWDVLGPVLTASPTPLEEREFQEDDFIFQQDHPSQCLQVILLTPASIESSNKQSVISQLQRFTTSISPSLSSKALAVLLSESAFSSASGKYHLDGFLTLQVFLFEQLSNPIPVILVPDSASFLSCIHEYMDDLEAIPVASPSISDSLALLAQANSDFPKSLSNQDQNILSDLFPSLRALSQGVHTQKGRDLLVNYLGTEQAAKIIKFWCKDIVRE